MTIAPTLGCNFACIYCYEGEHPDFSKMPINVQDQIVKLVETQALNGIKSLSIVWYGGEPLLAMDVIEQLTTRIYSICEKHEIQYNADIITNGYLLSREIVEKINACHINRIQITIDGPEEIHDKRRFLLNGQPTFKSILSNIINAVDILPTVSLRINVDKTNVDKVYEVKELFSQGKLSERVFPYVAVVDAINGYYDPERCLTLEKSAELDFGFYDNLMGLYPMPRANACGADSLNSLVIDPNGVLYKCWNDIEIEKEQVGTLGSSESNYYKRYYDYMAYDVTQDELCSSCNVLPLCMGGCPHRRLQNSPARCSRFKVSLDEYLKKIYSQILEKRDNRDNLNACIND